MSGLANRGWVAVLALIVTLTAAAGEQTPEEKIGKAIQLLDIDDPQKHDQAHKLLQEAQRELEAAIVGDSKNARLYSLLARACFFQQEDVKSLETIEKAISLAPTNGQYLFEKGNMLMEMDRFEPAKKAFLETAAVEPANSQPLVMAGIATSRAGQEKQALELFLRATKIDPKDSMAWSNVGQAYQNLGKVTEALVAFQTAVKIDGGDYRLLTKIIQCEQTLGHMDERDAARIALFDLFKAGEIDANLYGRDQFLVDKTKVIALEYFELKGERAVRYSFNVLDAAGKSKYRISLGSYETTTAASRSAGAIADDQRMFHLDGYYPDQHVTFGMFKQEPTYDQTKQMVIEILQGKAKPLSRTVYGSKTEP